MLEAVNVPKKKNKKRYINNADFFKAICEWQDMKELDSNARMSEYLGECFTKLADHMSRKCQSHSHKEDMKSHALLTCCLYAKNFNREKSENPFAYFTQYIVNAFAQVHNSEKKLINAKFNMIKEMNNVDGYDYREHEEVDTIWG